MVFMSIFGFSVKVSDYERTPYHSALQMADNNGDSNGEVEGDERLEAAYMLTGFRPIDTSEAKRMIKTTLSLFQPSRITAEWTSDLEYGADDGTVTIEGQNEGAVEFNLDLKPNLVLCEGQTLTFHLKASGTYGYSGKVISILGLPKGTELSVSDGNRYKDSEGGRNSWWIEPNDGQTAVVNITTSSKVNLDQLTIKTSPMEEATTTLSDFRVISTVL